ncbi:hypothetical protein SDC9_195185 [bioreactor metagenome]|uniref:Uncharacterized protein n=1 Tax=bioreactor metagenome TaxID=1076179 RepID=A0A645I9U9_9ZZZZ
MFRLDLFRLFREVRFQLQPREGCALVRQVDRPLRGRIELGLRRSDGDGQNVPALRPVGGDEVEVPPGGVEPRHVIGAVDGDYRAAYIFIVKDRLILQDRAQVLIGLFLGVFGPHRERPECAG